MILKGYDYEQPAEGVFIYKNILSEEELNKVNEYIESNSEWGKVWDFDSLHSDFLYQTLAQRIAESVKGEFETEGFATILRIKAGLSWGEHIDGDPEIFNLNKEYIEGSPFKEIDQTHYGVAFYFNEPIGGEIYYPLLNFEHKPMPGELIMHRCSEQHLHGVKPVLSDYRYSTSGRLYKKLKIGA
jgi:hypothetical protein